MAKTSLLDVVFWIAVVIAIVLGVILLYNIYLKITGHSPSETTIFGWAIAFIISIQAVEIGFLIKINYSLGKLDEFKEIVKKKLKFT